MENWTAEIVLGIISSGLSLIFAYVPMAQDWYNRLDSRYKPLLMAGMIALLVFGRLAVDCSFQWACIQGGLQRAAILYLACLVANHQTYIISVRQFRKR